MCGKDRRDWQWLEPGSAGRLVRFQCLDPKRSERAFCISKEETERERKLFSKGWKD
jgi:hypothetical protein